MGEETPVLLQTLNPLKGTVSEIILKRIAGAGMSYADLTKTFQEKGSLGIRAMLSSQDQQTKKPLVTRKKILNSIVTFFERILISDIAQNENALLLSHQTTDANDGPKHFLVSHDSMNASAREHPRAHSRRSFRVGLMNIGQTCYMNSVLQALFSTEQFAVRVLKCDSIGLHSNNLQIAIELKNIFTLLLCSEDSFVDPTDFFLSQRLPILSGESNRIAPNFLGIFISN